MLCARGELLLMADADGATVAAEEQRLEEALQKVKVRPRPACPALHAYRCKDFLCCLGKYSLDPCFIHKDSDAASGTV